MYNTSVTTVVNRLCPPGGTVAFVSEADLPLVSVHSIDLSRCVEYLAPERVIRSFKGQLEKEKLFDIPDSSVGMVNTFETVETEVVEDEDSTGEKSNKDKVNDEGETEGSEEDEDVVSVMKRKKFKVKHSDTKGDVYEYKTDETETSDANSEESLDEDDKESTIKISRSSSTSHVTYSGT